jgi:hypothetical protein
MPNYEATGFAHNKYHSAFVSLKPLYSLANNSSSAHAGVVFFMTADDARDLSIQLSKAANVADEIRQPDQPKEPT